MSINSHQSPIYQSKGTFRKVEEAQDEEFDRLIGKMVGVTPGKE